MDAVDSNGAFICTYYSFHGHAAICLIHLFNYCLRYFVNQGSSPWFAGNFFGLNDANLSWQL